MIESSGFIYPNELLVADGDWTREDGESPLAILPTYMFDNNAETGAKLNEAAGTATLRFGFNPNGTSIPLNYPSSDLNVFLGIGEISKTQVVTSIRFTGSDGDTNTIELDNYTGPGGVTREIRTDTALHPSLFPIGKNKVVFIQIATSIANTMISELSIKEFYEHGGQINIQSKVKQSSGIIYL